MTIVIKTARKNYKTQAAKKPQQRLNAPFFVVYTSHTANRLHSWLHRQPSVVFNGV